MIEVEKKFAPTKVQLTKLLMSAKFISEIVFKDVYFDTKDFSLILNDKWLRLRDDKLELKLPLGEIGHTHKSLDLYDEITNEIEIRKILNLQKNINIEKALEIAGYKAVASFVTIRKKYQKESFNIDVDEIDFGYNLIEIETLIKNKSGMKAAGKKILKFAKVNGLTVTYVRGKFVEYIFRKNKKLYLAMKNVGFFPDGN
jgi:predicted adenylyl cyclase CyaB